MAGTVIRVIPKTFVTFSNIPASASSPTLYWLARKIDVTSWTELTASVRCHPGSTISGAWGGGIPTVQVFEDGYTDEDPSVFPGFTSLAASLALPTSVPAGGSLQLLTIAPPGVGCCIAFAITAKTGTSPVADIQLSVDLCGKALRGPGDVP